MSIGYNCPACNAVFKRLKTGSTCPGCGIALVRRRIHNPETGPDKVWYEIVGDGQSPRGGAVAEKITEISDSEKTRPLYDIETIEDGRKMIVKYRAGQKIEDWIYCPKCNKRLFQNRLLEGELETKCPRCNIVALFCFTMRGQY